VVRVMGFHLPSTRIAIFIFPHHMCHIFGCDLRVSRAMMMGRVVISWSSLVEVVISKV
jgi:hypothetical protein